MRAGFAPMSRGSDIGFRQLRMHRLPRPRWADGWLAI